MKKVTHELQAIRYAYFLNQAFAKGAKIKKAKEEDFLKLYNAENKKFNWIGGTKEDELEKAKDQLRKAAETFISNASSLIERRLFRILLNDIEDAKSSEQIYCAAEGGLEAIEFVKRNNSILFN
ncbi:MAG: hypothetical protein RJA07_7 [Bacteroidota bacterium]|jgi:predicted RNA-binding protein with EMAP domain